MIESQGIREAHIKERRPENSQPGSGAVKRHMIFNKFIFFHGHSKTIAMVIIKIADSPITLTDITIMKKIQVLSELPLCYIEAWSDHLLLGNVLPINLHSTVTSNLQFVQNTTLANAVK